MTAAHVLAALDPNEYRVIPVGITTDGAWVHASNALQVQGCALGETPRDPGKLEVAGEPIDISALLSSARLEVPAAVVLPMLHGPLGEDGTIQGLLELSGIAYVG